MKMENLDVKGRMRINNGQIGSAIQQVSVLVNGNTSVSQIIANALVKFDLEVCWVLFRHQQRQQQQHNRNSSDIRV